MDSAQPDQTVSGVANLVEQCQCPPGYSGLSCECGPHDTQGPYRLGKCPSDDEEAITENDCSDAGSLLPVAGDKSCKCKSNVQGPSCDSCRNGTFYLVADNPKGCQECFCNGLTKDCQSAVLLRQTISTVFRTNPERFELTDEGLTRTFNQYLRVDASRQELVGNLRAEPNIYYWKLPAQYLGNKLTSYGGELRFRQEIGASQGDSDESPDIIINGNAGIQMNADTEKTSASGRKVLIHEKVWRRADGRAFSREHLLMALTNVQSILIKASREAYTPDSRIRDVELDIAIEGAQTGLPSVLAVEQCQCPPGYTGLSCESCLPGYYKRPGLYLDLCESCSCNGHSTTCDPSSGVCLDCQHNTEGRYCERCKSGYTGNATSGTPSDCSRVAVIPNPTITVSIGGTAAFSCQPFRPDFSYRSIEWSRPVGGLPSSAYQDSRGVLEIRDVSLSSAGTYVCTITTVSGLFFSSEAVLVVEASSTCRCDGTGSAQAYGVPTSSGCLCTCKRFVEGATCNRCKDGYFDLSAENVEGCQRCFCSGVSTSCSSSNLYRYEKEGLSGRSISVVTIDTLPASVQPRIEFGEARFNFSDLRGSRQNLFWSLPPSLTGYQADAYGGSLSYTISFIADGSPIRDVDVEILSGNNRLYYLLPDGPVSGIRKSIKVPIREGSWRTRSGQQIAREDFLRALNNVTAILVRLSYAAGMDQSSLSDLRLSGASNINRGLGLASSVERCTCPEKYSGLSCQDCAPGLKRTSNGVCQEDVQVAVTTQPRELTALYGGSAVFSCRVVPFAVDVEVEWTRDNGAIPAKATRDGNRLAIPNLQPEDAGVYRCTARGRVSGSSSDASTLIVQDLRIDVIVSPGVLELSEGERADFTCVGRSQVGSTTYVVSWTRERGTLPAGRSSEANGVLSIRDVRLEDAGFYTCTGSNAKSVDRKNVELRIKSKMVARIEPGSLYITEGGTGQARCVVTGRAKTVVWSRSGNAAINRRHQTQSSALDGDTLRFVNFAVDDRGYYYCKATGEGDIEVLSQPIIVDIFRDPVRIDRPTIRVQVGQRAEFKCTAATNVGVQDIRWYKQEGALSSKSTQQNGVLTIDRVEKNDEGTYVCMITTVSGQAARGTANLIVYYDEVQLDDLKLEFGQSGQLVCRSTLQDASYSWARQDSQPLPTGVRVQGNLLLFTNANNAMSGYYTCIATSSFGTQVGAAEVRVGLLIITPERMNVSIGSSVEITCSARPYAGVTPMLYWRSARGALLTEPAAGQAVLKFDTVTYNNQGNYTCVAEISGSSSSSTLELLVIEEQHGEFDWLYPSNPYSLRSPAGSSIELDCNPRSAAATRTQWLRVGTSLPLSARIVGPRLIINGLRKSDEGVYICRAFKGLYEGELKINLYIADGQAPGATINADGLRMPNGTSQTYSRGTTVTLSCTAEGDPAPAIEWRKISDDGRVTAVPQSTRIAVDENKITITGLRGEDAGYYQCIARNSVGQRDTYLRLVVDGGLVEPPSGVIVNGGGPSVTYDPGMNVVLSCQARSGTQPIRYQWSWSGGSLPRNVIVSNNILRLQDVVPQNSGTYYCTAVNDGGNSPTVSNPVQIAGLSLPKALSATSLQYRVGQTVQLRCELPSGGDVIEWAREGNFPLPASSRLTSQGQILEISNLKPQDSGSYYCRASSTIRGTSQRVRISVQVIEGDSQQTVSVGDNVLIECKTPPSSNKRLVWSRENGLPMPPSATFQDASNSTLRIPNIKLADAGVYYCREVGESGEGPSVGARIIVEGKFMQGSDIPETPTLGVNSLLDYPAGSTVVLRCDSGDTSADIIWLRAGSTQLPANSRASGATLTIPNIRPEDGGIYYCAARSTSGTSSYVEIQLNIKTVAPPLLPIISGSSVSGEYQVGATVTLVCSGRGEPMPDIAWINTNALRSNVQVSGGQLRITNLQRENAGDYICRASNAYGSRDSRVTILATRGRPSQPVASAGAPTMHQVAPGSGAKLTCESRTPGAYTEWVRVGRLPIPQTHEIDDQSTLILKNIQPEDAGRYECRARSEYGDSDALQHIVSIIGSRPSVPDITGSKSSRVGASVQLKCTATGQPAPTYEWTRPNDLPLPRQSRVDGATGLITISNMQIEDSGIYTCTARNVFGSSATAARIAPEASSEPARLEISSQGVRFGSVDANTFMPGTNLTIVCKATGDPQITIEWRRQGRVLPIESSPGLGVLTIRNLKAEDAGTYECRALVPGLGRLLTGNYDFIVPVAYAPNAVKVTVSGYAPGGGGIPVGGNAQLLCEANGSPAPRYQWSRLGSASLPATAIAQENILRITSMQASYQGTYVCVASNNFGRAESAVSLVLTRPAYRKYLISRAK